MLRSCSRIRRSSGAGWLCVIGCAFTVTDFAVGRVCSDRMLVMRLSITYGRTIEASSCLGHSTLHCPCTATCACPPPLHSKPARDRTEQPARAPVHPGPVSVYGRECNGIPPAFAVSRIFALHIGDEAGNIRDRYGLNLRIVFRVPPYTHLQPPFPRAVFSMAGRPGRRPRSLPRSPLMIAWFEAATGSAVTPRSSQSTKGIARCVFEIRGWKAGAEHA
jgi:hypothetical protein